MSPFDNPNWWKEFIGFGAFAAAAGAIGHILRSLEEGTKISLARTAVEALGAGFVGILVVLFCKAMQLDVIWTGLTVGVFGWLGARVTILVLEKAVLKRLGLSKPEVSQNDSPSP